VRDRTGGEPEYAARESEHERPRVAEATDDRPDETSLDDRAEHTERREHIAGLRRIEPEAARGEQRERRLKDCKSAPVRKVDDEHAADDRPAQQFRQIRE